MHHLTADMAQLFSGLSTAHGKYRVEGTAPNGKRKGSAITLTAPVTVELWGLHLAGVEGLGIVPIKANNGCRFGAIDIDDYALNLQELNIKIQLRRFPLVLCKTKSGGAHLYAFFKEDVPATEVIDKLRAMAGALGHGRAEIFPKQAKLLAQRGDVGSWINMPYFGADKTDRFALGPDHKRLTLEAFLEYAKTKQVSAAEFAAVPVEPESLLPDGPPCLQRLTSEGFPEGTRNSGLFNIGIYAKKAFPDAWKVKIEEYNVSFMKPPLTSQEVLGVIRALDKHDYNYTCKTAPLEAVCNADACRRCKFGVGRGDFGMPRFGSLTKLTTNPPIWFLDIEGGHRLELTTEQLQSPVAFQRMCMEVLHTVPGIPKRAEWTDILAELFENVNVVEAPKQGTARGHLLALFEEFATSRVRARTKEEILLGKPFTSGDFTYFRMKDFIKFLERQRFSLLDLNAIVATLREEHGLKEHRFNIKGTLIAVVCVPVVRSVVLDSSDLPQLPDQVEPV